MSNLLNMNSLAPWLPIFEEITQDIPPGYGIEQSADGGWYPYAVNIADSRQIAYLKDRRGLDLRCDNRHQALSTILAEVAA